MLRSDATHACREVEEGERVAATALLMSVHSTVSKLARSLGVGGADEDRAEELTGEYFR